MLSISAAAARLGISDTATRKLVEREKLAVASNGKPVMVAESSVERRLGKLVSLSPCEVPFGKAELLFQRTVYVSAEYPNILVRVYGTIEGSRITNCAIILGDLIRSGLGLSDMQLPKHAKKIIDGIHSLAGDTSYCPQLLNLSWNDAWWCDVSLETAISPTLYSEDRGSRISCLEYQIIQLNDVEKRIGQIVTTVPLRDPEGKRGINDFDSPLGKKQFLDFVNDPRPAEKLWTVDPLELFSLQTDIDLILGEMMSNEWFEALSKKQVGGLIEPLKNILSLAWSKRKEANDDNDITAWVSENHYDEESLPDRVKVPIRWWKPSSDKIKSLVPAVDIDYAQAVEISSHLQTMRRSVDRLSNNESPYLERAVRHVDDVLYALTGARAAYKDPENRIFESVSVSDEGKVAEWEKTLTPAHGADDNSEHSRRQRLLRNALDENRNFNADILQDRGGALVAFVYDQKGERLAFIEPPVHLGENAVRVYVDECTSLIGGEIVPIVEMKNHDLTVLPSSHHFNRGVGYESGAHGTALDIMEARRQTQNRDADLSDSELQRITEILVNRRQIVVDL